MKEKGEKKAKREKEDGKEKTGTEEEKEDKDLLGQS